MRRIRSLLLILLISVHAFTASALVLAEAPTRGPAIGNVRYRTEIGPVVTDVDDYVGALVRGERLSVHLDADRGSALVPEVAVIGPDGVERAPPVVARRAGVASSIRDFEIDTTGRWTVRVRGAGGSVGAYSLRFRVAPPRRVVVAGQTLGGGGPIVRDHAVDAVDGASLTAVVRSARVGTLAAIEAITGPADDAVPFGAPARRGQKATWDAVRLTAGDGTYRVTVGLEDGSASYDLALAVSPPARPRGTVRLSPLEPKIPTVIAPLAGNAKQHLHITGANLSALPPAQVWFGSRRGSVVRSDPFGSWIDVVPPAGDDGEVVDVAVVNPDGQAVVRAAYFVYVAPVPVTLAALTPGTASVYAGHPLRMRVTLTKPAPISGVSIALTAAPGLGAVPPVVTVGAFQTAATFELSAGPLPASGLVEARHGDTAAAAEITVVALPDDGGGGGGGGDEPPPPLPDEIDISGWSVVQATSPRTFTLPPGTKLVQGDYVVIARACGRPAFEAYWGVTLGPNVRFFSNDPMNTGSASDDWPSINGDETFTLRDRAGATVDGPTVAMQTGGLANYQRIAGHAAGQAASWTHSTQISPGAAPTPGSGQAPPTAKHGVHVSEFSDVSSGGTRWTFEFVELHFDGNP